ncbi:MAG: HipA N-terminal domain-containing protein [Myxococcota bacterium]|nr:HipA N-terminal domain-containing protein [Myxococcota bacterium]
MKAYLTSAAEAVRDQLESWRRVWGPGKRPAERLEVYQARPDGKSILVGFLSQDGSEFVFRYSPSFTARRDAVPISAFPDLHQDEYRADKLWPFFGVRLPPLDRDDVKEALVTYNLSPDEPLKLLARLARRTVSSPYELHEATVG